MFRPRLEFLVFAFCLVSFSPFFTSDALSQDLEQALSRAIRSTENGEFAKQHSLLIYKDGNLVVERYWSGEDGRRGNRNFDSESLHDLRSCSKSVVGLLVGIAIDEKLLPSDLGTKAYKLFPDKKFDQANKLTGAQRSITLEHLLNMTDGMDWQQHETKDHVNNESKMEGSLDSVGYVWSQPMKRPPGKEFNYNSGATALLAGAIKRAAGKSIEQYAAEKLFKPLQIRNWEWMQGSDKEPAAHYGLRMSSRDMLKIGRLILQKGKWNGQQLVSKDWIVATVDHQRARRHYVNQWWLENLLVGEKKDRQVRAVVAYGKGGQAIYVLPEQNAVVVFTAGHYEDGHAAGDSNRFLKRKIIPVLDSLADDATESR